MHVSRQGRLVAGLARASPACPTPTRRPRHPHCAADTAKFAKFHRGMLEHGVYLAPSQFEAGFTSLAHTEADIDATIAAAKEVLKSIPN